MLFNIDPYFCTVSKVKSDWKLIYIINIASHQSSNHSESTDQANPNINKYKYFGNKIN